MDDRSRTISVPQAAALLGVSRGAVYKAARSGELPSIRLGRRVLVPRAALDRLIPAPTTQEN